MTKYIKRPLACEEPDDVATYCHTTDLEQAKCYAISLVTRP